MRKLLPIALTLLALTAGIAIKLSRTDHKPVITGPALTVHFLRADCGNAVVMRTPDKNTIIIDPKPGKPTESLLAYLKEIHVKSAILIITNPDTGSATAVKQLSDFIHIIWLMRGDLGERTDEWEGYISRIPGQSISETILARGDHTALSRNVRLEALNPPAKPLVNTGSDQDNNSLVLRISYGNRRFLFPSDIRLFAEADLIASDIDMTADVFAIGRNGRYGSTSLEFISVIRPEVCVIGVGNDNNKPAQAILNRLNPDKTGAALYRTDKDGIIEIVTDGRKMQINTDRS